MKKVWILLFAAAGMAACKSSDKKLTDAEQQTKDSLAKIAANPPVTIPADTSNQVSLTEVTTIEWLDSTFLDLGKQTEGKSIDITYRFKNTGNKPLVIKDIHAQCGCTTPKKIDEPIAPGEEGKITAQFNGNGHGETRKEIYVTANTNPTNHTLVFRANLVK